METAHPRSSVKPEMGWRPVGRSAQNFRRWGWEVRGWLVAHTFSKALLTQAAGVGKFILSGGRVGMGDRAARHSFRCSGSPDLRCSPKRPVRPLQFPGQPGFSPRWGRGLYHPK